MIQSSKEDRQELDALIRSNASSVRIHSLLYANLKEHDARFVC